MSIQVVAFDIVIVPVFFSSAAFVYKEIWRDH